MGSAATSSRCQWLVMNEPPEIAAMERSEDIDIEFSDPVGELAQMRIRIN